MRHPEGTIIKRGKTSFRARVHMRSQEYSKTFSTAGDAEMWLLDLRLAADEDDVIHRRGIFDGCGVARPKALPPACATAVQSPLRLPGFF